MTERYTSILVSTIAGAIGGAVVATVLIGNQAVPEIVVQADGTEIKVGETYEALVIKATETANPAVVSIVVTKNVPIIERYYEDYFGGNLYSPYNLPVPQYRQNGTQRQEVGGGSGWLVSSDGMIITNKHVVAEDDVEYTVFLNDGTKYDAQIVARDPVNDLAVIRITGNDLPFLELADSDQLKVGQTVIAIGNALAQYRNTVSVGVISGLARTITAGNGRGQSENLEEVIQTDAAINPGNSGGPLLNLDGKVVGVNVAVARGSENIGFALPSNLVRGVVDSVNETGKIVRPFLGVRYAMINPLIKEQNSLPVDQGALVLKGNEETELAVIPGSPADKAGLAEGDIILSIDGTALGETASLSAVIAKKRVGDTVTLKLLQNGAEVELTVVLAEIPQ